MRESEASVTPPSPSGIWRFWWRRWANSRKRCCRPASKAATRRGFAPNWCKPQRSPSRCWSAATETGGPCAVDRSRPRPPPLDTLGQLAYTGVMATSNPHALRVQIDNRTDYDGRVLRAVTLATLRHNGAMGTHHVEFYYSRQRARAGTEADHTVPIAGTRSAAVMGWGYYDQNSMRIGLPNTGETAAGGRVRIDRVPAAVVAHVIEHEHGHNVGLRHTEMTEGVRWWGPSPWNPRNGGPPVAIPEWVGRRAPKAKPAKPTAAERHAAAVERLEETIAEAERAHARRRKALQTRLRKAKRLHRDAVRRESAPAAAKPATPKPARALPAGARWGEWDTRNRRGWLDGDPHESALHLIVEEADEDLRAEGSLGRTVCGRAVPPTIDLDHWAFLDEVAPIAPATGRGRAVCSRCAARAAEAARAAAE